MISTSSITTRPRRRACRALCVCLALCLLPAAALSSSTVPTTMRVAMVVPEDMALHPLTTMDRDAVSLLNLVYESLFVLDDDRNPAPYLVESYSTISDGTTWIFTLRDSVYFHDGRKMTAYDVTATLDAIKAMVDAEEAGDGDRAKMGLYSEVVKICSSWQATDEYTLTIRTNRPYYGLLYSLTFPILQAQSIYSDIPPGTGPYRIDFYAPGDQLWLTGNQNWWSGRPPHISEVVGVWYESDDAALSAFEAEQVDIMMSRSPAAVRYRGLVSSRASSYDYSTRQLECLMINYAVNSLNKDKVEMRQAIAHAINKNRLMTNVYQGTVTSTDTVLSPGTWLYNENVSSQYAYNAEEANRLLDEAGWELRDDEGYRYRRTDSGEQQLSYRLGYYDEAGNAMRKEAANEIANMLKAVGIRVRILTYTFENAAAKLSAGDYDLFLCALNYDVTPDPNFIFRSDGRGNYARYRSEDMVALCTELRKCLLEIEFQQKWYEIQELAAADLPFIPLYWRNGILLSRYPFSSVRDIREFELLRSIERYQ